MIRQSINVLTVLSMALSPLSAFAGKNEADVPKNKCDKDMVDRLWRSDKQELKDEFQGYYHTPKKKRTMTEAEFCEDFQARFDTESGFCPNGDCKKGQAKVQPIVEERHRIKDMADEQAEDVRPVRRRPEPVVREERPVYNDNAGGGFFGGGNNMMGMMLAGGIGGLLGAMIAGGGQQQQPSPYQFRQPFGRPPPFMPMNPGGRGMPPRFAPYQAPMFGGAPGMVGGGYGAPGMIGGGYGAPGVMGGYGVPAYNGAQIYNGGASYGGVGYGAPAIINPATGMRTYSVGGSTAAPTYHLLGK